ncbi:MAG TPA: DUF1573 domain-containing protein [Bacteroidales bacterium]|nr:DUF1573 domain-containing protein [Bacteroidales bacterium]
MKANRVFSILFALIVMTAVSLKAQDAAPAATSSISWKNTTIDLGKIEKGKPVSVVFEFTNPSMVPLVLNSVRPTCGCTVADYTKEPVAPGKAGKITLTYNAASVGPFTKSTVVSSNSADGNATLIIKGEVVEKN